MVTSQTIPLRANTLIYITYTRLAGKIRRKPVKADDLVQIIDRTCQIYRPTLKTIQGMGQAEQSKAAKLIGDDQIKTRATPLDVGEDGTF